MTARSRYSWVTVVSLSAWLGASLLVATTVAPAAFDVLPSRSLAGALVGRVLPVLFLSGLGIAMAAIVTEARASQGRRLMTLGPLIGLGAGCAIAQFIVGPRIARVREAIAGPIEALPAGDPLRQQFGMLHGISVFWLGVAMVAACIAIAVRIRASRSPVIPAADSSLPA